MTAAQRLADWAVDADFSNETSAREVVVDAVIDTLGCIHAGWRDPVSQKALDAARSWGSGNASVFGTGEKLPAPSAAFVNGVAAHALDYDDCEVAGTTHNSAAMLPALLALAEGDGLTGKEVIDAYIAGFEVIVRIGQAIGYGHYTTGWHATSTTGTIGSAAACARLLGLDAATTATAIAIAATLAGGLKSHFGTDTKPVHAGLAARSGITAAQLAASGITANAAALDEPLGFIDIMNNEPAPGFASPLTRLGKPLAIDEVGICTKAYPSCNYTHRPIEAMLELRARLNDISAIEHMSIRVPESFYAVASKHKPQTPPEARFSITWCLAVAACDGEVRIAHFEPDALARPDLRSLESRARVDPFQPAGGASDMVNTVPDTLEIRLKSGETLSSTIGKVRGSPQWPMTEAERQAKFTDCMSAHAGVAESTQIFELLTGFDEDTPVKDLLNCLEDCQKTSSPPPCGED